MPMKNTNDLKVFMKSRNYIKNDVSSWILSKSREINIDCLKTTADTL